MRDVDFHVRGNVGLYAGLGRFGHASDWEQGRVGRVSRRGKGCSGLAGGRGVKLGVLDVFCRCKVNMRGKGVCVCD